MIFQIFYDIRFRYNNIVDFINKQENSLKVKKQILIKIILIIIFKVTLMQQKRKWIMFNPIVTSKSTSILKLKSHKILSKPLHNFGSSDSLVWFWL